MPARDALLKRAAREPTPQPATIEYASRCVRSHSAISPASPSWSGWKPGFHPNQLGNADEMAQWLQAQRDAYSIVAS